MSDFLSRFVNLVKGAGHSFLKDLEQSNPEAVYQAAIDTQKEQALAARRSLSQLESRRRQIEGSRPQLRREVESLSARATELSRTQEQKALELLEQKALLQEKLAALELEGPALETRITDQQKRVQEATDALNRLKAERDEALLQMRLSDPQALSSGAPGLASADLAVQAVRERLDRLGATVGIKPGGAESAEAARARRQDAARAELDRLRASAPVTPDAPGDGTTSPPGRTWKESGEAPSDPSPAEALEQPPGGRGTSVRRRTL